MSAVINSDDVYATRSSLIPQKIGSTEVLTLKKDETFVSTIDYCFDGTKLANRSSGNYYMKKYNRLDSLFTLESNNCPGIGSDLHFTLKNKSLEIYLPSVTGYRIQIFEKVPSK